MTESERRHVVIVGGGVTGLSAAYHLHRACPGLRLTLLESAGRLGGNIATHRSGGFVLEAGPDSFVRTKPAGLRLVEQLGLREELISTAPGARRVYLATGNKLELMPEGMALGVPTRLSPLLGSPVLGWRAKLRLLAEPLQGRARVSREESIAEFLNRRLGAEAAEQLAAPLLSGIYAGDAEQLSMQATFPQLLQLEQRYRSLVIGTLAERGKRELARRGLTPRPGLRGLLEQAKAAFAEAESPFYSFRGGMSRLIEALAESLPEGAIRLNAGVRGVRPMGAGFEVQLDEEVLRADGVVLACPARVSARILPSSPLATQLGLIPYRSTATVSFAFARERVPHALDGVGFVVPQGMKGRLKAGPELLAGTFISSKWDHRAPPGFVLLRVFFGDGEAARGMASSLPGSEPLGRSDEAQDALERSSDAELLQLARQALQRWLGPVGEPEWTRIFRFHRGNPQPLLGHGARVQKIRALASEFPGLELIGASFDGVGIPDCVAQAEQAAARLSSRFA